MFSASSHPSRAVRIFLAMVHINCISILLFLSMIALSRSFRVGPFAKVSTMSRSDTNMLDLFHTTCLLFSDFTCRDHKQRRSHHSSRSLRALCMAVEVKTMEMKQFAEILKGDERKVSLLEAQLQGNLLLSSSS